MQASPRKLSPRETAFVRAFVEGASGEDAARIAGYSPIRAGVQSRVMLVNPLILNAIDAEVRHAIKAAAPLALRRLTSLVSDSQSDHVRLQAASDLLDRAGYSAQTAPASDASTLTVTLHLGGSKTHESELVTHPHPQNFPLMVDHDPGEGVAAGAGDGDAAGGTGEPVTEGGFGEDCA